MIVTVQACSCLTRDRQLFSFLIDNCHICVHCSSETASIAMQSNSRRTMTKRLLTIAWIESKRSKTSRLFVCWSCKLWYDSHAYLSHCFFHLSSLESHWYPVWMLSRHIQLRALMKTSMHEKYLSNDCLLSSACNTPGSDKPLGADSDLFDILWSVIFKLISQREHEVRWKSYDLRISTFSFSD